jgi:hypothetical protein
LDDFPGLAESMRCFTFHGHDHEFWRDDRGQRSTGVFFSRLLTRIIHTTRSTHDILSTEVRP